jgi:carbon storage regulator
MLVLSRTKGESIMIGDQIEVVVLSVEGEVVKLGLRAPRSIEIHRMEVYDSIKNSNQEAMSTLLDPEDLTKFMNEKPNSKDSGAK